MPKLRETPLMKANKRFRMSLAAGLAGEEKTEAEAAALMNVTDRTLRSYKKDPCNVTVGQLRALYQCDILTEADVAAIICY